MGLTAFNRARRLAAERLAQQQTQASAQEQPEESATVADLGETDSDSESTVTREEREAQLKAMNWEALKELLGSYELPTAKPKGISWDEFAIPQILQHEGF